MSAFGKRTCKPAKTPALQTPVRIDTQVRTPDGRGGYALAWTPLYSTYAERSDLTGGETLLAAQVTNTQMKRFKLRWPPNVDLSAAQRLVDLTTNRTYNIRDVGGPDQMNRWVTLLCEYILGSTGA
jgi:head-tail adaptor